MKDGLCAVSWRTGPAGAPRFPVALMALLLVAFACLTAYADKRDTVSVGGSKTLAPRTLRVGPHREVLTIWEASRLARDGDTIEIDGGEYPEDLAIWTQDNLTIRGINGQPHLAAAGQAAEGKAIWVIRGGHVVVENIKFSGARVRDHNGAGIRLESGNLTVRRCAFIDNENGMLVANNPDIVLDIEDSEFGDNGAGDGQSHNLYVGSIQRLTVTGSHFHHARVGHLLKSRARENFIYYNRLADGPGGRASYELEFPSGGRAFVVGNLIQQGPQTENPALISFGAEGYSSSTNELYLSHNTIVNDRAQGGVFVASAPGPGYVRMVNNIFVGKGEIRSQARTEQGTNWNVDFTDFAIPAHLDFRLKSASKAAGAARPPGAAASISLTPSREYTYPAGTIPVSASSRLSPGAFQTLVN